MVFRWSRVPAALTSSLHLCLVCARLLLRGPRSLRPPLGKRHQSHTRTQLRLCLDSVEESVGTCPRVGGGRPGGGGLCHMTSIRCIQDCFLTQIPVRSDVHRRSKGHRGRSVGTDLPGLIWSRDQVGTRDPPMDEQTTGSTLGSSVVPTDSCPRAVFHLFIRQSFFDTTWNQSLVPSPVHQMDTCTGPCSLLLSVVAW